MSKIEKKEVKCACCGELSEQLIVGSINYLLGSKEANDKLRSWQQECPGCGYKAMDISVLEIDYVDPSKDKNEENKIIVEKGGSEKIKDAILSDKAEDVFQVFDRTNNAAGATVIRILAPYLSPLIPVFQKAGTTINRFVFDNIKKAAAKGRNGNQTPSENSVMLETNEQLILDNFNEGGISK